MAHEQSQIGEAFGIAIGIPPKKLISKKIAYCEDTKKSGSSIKISESKES